jgi:hypothetical protein
VIPQCAQGGTLPLGKAFREFETIEAETIIGVLQCNKDTDVGLFVFLQQKQRQSSFVSTNF